MQAWECFVEELESELGSESVQKWLKSLKVLRFDAGNLYLEANDAFQAMWFEEHVRQKVAARLVNNNRRKIKVHLTVADARDKIRAKPSKKNAAPPVSPPAFTLTFESCDLGCTFDNYVESESNALTCKVFKQIAQKKGDLGANSVVSPVFLHGEAGAGKTHLLTATAHELNRLGYRVVYARAQLFADHVVAAIRAGEMRAFREAYRNCDVLIIDDVHVLSRKAATQEEFFHTFNTLHVAGKMIILSANCPPGELQHIEPRLVSRFEWGIVLSLDHPSKETKAQILTAKSRAYDLALHPKVSDFLIETFQTTHSLTRAVEALVLRSHLKPHSTLSATSQLTIASAKQMLHDLIAVEEEAAMTPDEIIHCVAEHFGVLPEDILGKAKTRDSVLPRQIAMHLCRTQLEIPFLRIGALFGRDHSTVMSSVKLIQKGIDSDDNEIGAAHRAILRKMRA